MGFAYFFFLISNPKQCFCDLTIHHIILGSSVRLLILDNSDSYFDLFINDLGCTVPRGTLWRPRQILRFPVWPRTAERLPENALLYWVWWTRKRGRDPITWFRFVWFTSLSVYISFLFRKLQEALALRVYFIRTPTSLSFSKTLGKNWIFLLQEPTNLRVRDSTEASFLPPPRLSSLRSWHWNPLKS